MATFISRSPEQTQALGEEWGKAATLGLVIGLTGDLGAGKTELVKGIARGLGATTPVRSPTFALVHEYTGGRLPLFHLDLYRLESPAQIHAAGLEEYFHAPPGVTVIEWIERLGPLQKAISQSGAHGTACPALKWRQVRIESLGENERRIIYDDFGP
jgi:tRNA threonylcarbamoyladenosine biosynthesis protein TsaE